MLSFVIISIFIVVFCTYILTKRKKTKIVNTFPSPPGAFLLGHILNFASSEDMLHNLSEWTKVYGSTFQLQFGPFIKTIVTSERNLAHFILNQSTSVKKSANYGFLKHWLGSATVISEGKIWQQKRKLLKPAFSLEMLKIYIKAFEFWGDIFIEQMLKMKETTNIDIYPFLSLFTLDVLCDTTMGAKANTMTGENFSYFESLKAITKIVANRIHSIIKQLDCTFIFTPDYFREKKALGVINTFASDMIRIRKEHLRNGTNDNSKNNYTILDLLLKFRDNDGAMLNDYQIKSEVNMMIFAGHDSTAFTASMVLFCLSKHPEIQQRVLEEQKHLFGDVKSPPVTYADLQNMKFLENVIKETFRLYTPGPIIGRCTTEDLKYEDKIIEKNTNVLVNVYGIHKNPEYFPDPEKFDPDRFEDQILPNSFCPFGLGEKNCIGQKFGYLELKSIIAKILRHFEIKPCIPEHKISLSANLILTATNGIKISLEHKT